MKVSVRLHGSIVGTITLEHGDLSVFRFDPAYLEQPERPVLGRWFEDRLGPGFEYKGIHSKLPSFFQNYLPEDGSALRVLIARRAGVKPHRELQLLREIGGDLPGAAVVSHDEGDEEAPPPSGGPAEGAAGDWPLRFSLAGVQLKFSVLRNETRFTLPVTGAGGRWIVKLPDADYPRVPENEFSALTWARAAGIEVPDFELVDVANVEGLPAGLNFAEPLALAIRRFDRTEAGARVHQEDFAQVLDVPADEKYERANYTTLGNVVYRVCGEADWHEYLRRLAFVVLSGNHDAHLKNWSLVYPDGRRARLSPAYDLVSTVCFSAHDPRLDQRLALPLSRERDMQAITLEHFRRMAIKVGANPERAADAVGELVARAREAWQSLRGELRLGADALGALEAHLARLKL
jgi:serine/threonine-protein kinase HipA